MLMFEDTYLPNPLPARDLFIKLKFRESQLDAMRQLYNKYFKYFIEEDFKYKGNAVSVFWSPGANKIGRNFHDPLNAHGYNIEEASSDPLWNEFADILPYMGKHGTITHLPPFSVMTPHIDRPGRPVPIYFPISGCLPNGMSDCYNLPKNKDPNVYHSYIEPAMPIYSYAITDSAYMLNPHEWHGVRNYTRETRIAFGWNTAGDRGRKSYRELQEIFTKLGYINEQ